jgi:AcrR family transcriptional regulator
MPGASPRLHADERRESAIRAAVTEFGARGFAGTSTRSIAERVGVSEPYLFKLFGTKKNLFLAAVRACFERCRSAFEASAGQASARSLHPADLFTAMGRTYVDLLADRDLLRLQLQAYAACDDPEIRDVVRHEWIRLYEAVARASGGDEREISAWFAEGMLLIVAASIGDLDAAVGMKLAVGGPPARP